MAFHESLNPERKLSFAIPFGFMLILGGTTAVVEVATLFSSQAAYASNPQALTATLGDASKTEVPPATPVNSAP